MPPLVFIAVAWGVGLVAARHWLAPAGVEPVSLALLSLIPLAAAALWRKDRVVRLVGLSAFALLLAALRYQTALPNFDDPQFIANYNDRGWVTFEGVVRGYPDRRDTATLLSLDTEWIEVDGQVRHMQGTVLVYGPRLPEYGSGDRQEQPLRRKEREGDSGDEGDQCEREQWARPRSRRRRRLLDDRLVGSLPLPAVVHDGP